MPATRPTKKQQRTSPNCVRVKNIASNARKYITVVLLLVLIVPILYLIPCATSRMRFVVDRGCDYDDFTVPMNTYGVISNVTISQDEDVNEYDGWTVSSIDVYYSSYTPSAEEPDFIRKIVYEGGGEDYASLKVEVLGRDNETRKISDEGSEINGLIRYFDIPVDYVASYLKMTITTNSSAIGGAFSVDFYDFFVGEKRSTIKYGLVFEVRVNSVNFDADAYEDWFSWKFLGGETPESYPYTISTSIRRYNDITDYLEVDTI